MTDTGRSSGRGPDFVDDTGLTTRTKVRLGLAAVLAVVMLVFVLSNTQDTEVSWLGFDFTAPLWIVLLASAILGAVVLSLVGFFWRRRRAKP